MRVRAVWRTAIACGISGLLLGGCADRPTQPKVPSATVGTEPAATTTTNPYAVPAVIDAAYVNRVLAWLDRFEGDILRSVMSSKTLAPDDVARLRAINATDGMFQVTLDAYQYSLRSGFSGVLPNPGDAKTVVLEILSTKSSCIYVKADRDNAAVARSPNPSLRTLWVALRRLDTSAIPNSYNATGWGYQMNGGAFGARPTPPESDPCAPY